MSISWQQPARKLAEIGLSLPFNGDGKPEAGPSGDTKSDDNDELNSLAMQSSKVKRLREELAAAEAELSAMAANQKTRDDKSSEDVSDEASC